MRIKDLGVNENSVVLIMDRTDALLMKKAMELANTVSREYFHDLIIQSIDNELKDVSEPQKNIYNKLCDAVGKHSKEAEKYLREEAIKLASFKYKDNIDACFQWAEAPQGSGYWSRLNMLVGRVK